MVRDYDPLKLSSPRIFLIRMLVFLILVTYWPPLSLWLPKTLGMMN